MIQEKPPIGVLIYDSQCNLCLKTKAWFEKWDAQGKVGFHSAHDPNLLAMYPQTQGLDLLGQITWVDQQGQIKRGADAIATALSQLPTWRWAGIALSLPGARVVRNMVYGWIARHRYRLFGRTCDTGGCRIDSKKSPYRSPRLWPSLFSIVVVVMVGSPILQNLRAGKDRRDDFPLSYYPMFSSERPNLFEQSFIGAIKQDGSVVPVHYSLLGDGGLNQNRRQLNKLLKSKDDVQINEYLNSVAKRLRSSKKSQYRDCVAVAAIEGTYDLNAYFADQEKAPTKTDVLMQVALQDRYASSVQN